MLLLAVTPEWNFGWTFATRVLPQRYSNSVHSRSILRENKVTWTGFRRDTLVLGLLSDEWSSAVLLSAIGALGTLNGELACRFLVVL